MELYICLQVSIFQGALYLLYGENRRSVVYKRSWDAMNKTWPALIKAKHSEKPSFVKLMDNIADKVHKNIESTELSIKVCQKCKYCIPHNANVLVGVL